jgi:hypothetical protein
MALETGKYAVECKAKIGLIKGFFNATVDGGALTGSLDVLGSDEPLSDGKVEGDDFSCSVKVKTPLGKKDSQVTGKCIDGNITGNLKIKMIGDLKYTAKKV